jgi:hypothetical protein
MIEAISFPINSSYQMLIQYYYMDNLREKTRIIGKRKNLEDIELVNVESIPV